MSGTMAGQSVLVTGAGSGIGAAIAAAIVEADGQVVGLDRDPDGLSVMQARYPEAFRTVIADLTDAKAVGRGVERAWRAFGQLDGLVNCAGIYPVTPFLDLAVEEWDAVLSVNLRAPFLLTQATARRMIEAKVKGRVVNISSTASVLSRPGVAHYGASKAAISQLTRNLAIELAPHGIRVNAVAPGLIATERVMSHAHGPGAAEHATKLARIPLGREGRPEELCGLALYLLSEESSYCTGSVFFIDGGVTLGIPSY